MRALPASAPGAPALARTPAPTLARTATPALRSLPGGQAVARAAAPGRARCCAPRRRARSAPAATPVAGAAGSSGARLARALGLPLETQPDGSVSVTLDAAAALVAGSAGVPMLARAPEGGDAESAPSPAPAPAPASGPAPAAAAAPAGAPAPSLEDTYDYVVERLRRDLLNERERMGDLIGRLP